MKKLLVTLVLFFTLKISGQSFLPPGTYTSSDKKALKYFDEGKKFYDARQDKKAEEFLLKSIEADPKFMEPHVIISILCGEQKRYKDEVFHLREAIKKGPNIYVENYFNLALAEIYIEDYSSAKIHLEQFLKFQKISPAEREDAEFYLKSASFAVEAIKKPVKINFTNMGSSVNTNLGEYFPSLTADENVFLFTRRHITQGIDPYQEDLYISKKLNGAWTNGIAVKDVNSPGNEGAPCISADGNYMFITASQEMDGAYMGGRGKGYGSCDIFYTFKQNGVWSKPVNLGPAINSKYWESQPSFSSDGKTLYFVRGTPLRNGTVKNIDIYCSTIGLDGSFQTAVKLPDNINTTREEEYAFIHPDNQTLYFSSEGHPGMGGLDIFMCKKLPNGKWSDPVNLGYPINTSRNENSLMVAPSGRLAYFASDRDGGFGSLDIYQFEMPESLRPEKLTYVKGKVYNAKTKEPLEAKFELFDLETQQNVTELYSDKAGQFLVTLTANKNYIVNVNRDGFLFYSDNFSLKGKVADFDKPFVLDIPLQPIDTGSTVELKNVFFDVDKWELKPESKAELDKLVLFLTKNPNVKIELGGHTDNSGKKDWNKTLSTNRAKAVYDYLITNGKIAAARLSYKGYAETRPKVANDTPENKAKNRRTEFKVVGK